MAYQINITRGDDWDESYDVWAKAGTVPLEDGDGLFVGNFHILPEEDTISITSWAPPTSATYGILVVPIQRRIGGISGVFAP